MKFARTSNRLLFLLGQRETRTFLATLRLYPRIPPAHHRLSKSGKIPEAAASQRLLDEALAEQRAENRKLLQALLVDPKRFTRTETGSRLTLTPAETEWLLQVFNDIRVGSWILLGAPDEKLELAVVNETTARRFLEMETAGIFQMQLLAGLEGGVARQT